MTPIGIELETLWLVEQCLNQLRHRVFHCAGAPREKKVLISAIGERKKGSWKEAIK
jgi:hypothetical protein